MAGIQCFTPPNWGTVGQAMRAIGKRAESSSSHSVGIDTSGPRPRQAATIRAAGLGEAARHGHQDGRRHGERGDDERVGHREGRLPEQRPEVHPRVVLVVKVVAEPALDPRQRVVPEPRPGGDQHHRAEHRHGDERPGEPVAAHHAHRPLRGRTVARLPSRGTSRAARRRGAPAAGTRRCAWSPSAAPKRSPEATAHPAVERRPREALVLRQKA